jgi:hypothetical protein
LSYSHPYARRLPERTPPDNAGRSQSRSGKELGGGAPDVPARQPSSPLVRFASCQEPPARVGLLVCWLRRYPGRLRTRTRRAVCTYSGCTIIHIIKARMTQFSPLVPECRSLVDDRPCPVPSPPYSVPTAATALVLAMTPAAPTPSSTLIISGHCLLGRSETKGPAALHHHHSPELKFASRRSRRTHQP